MLEGIAERIRTMPPERRPRVVLMGESLGANVALDVAQRDGQPFLPVLDEYGVEGGLPGLKYGLYVLVAHPCAAERNYAQLGKSVEALLHKLALHRGEQAPPANKP